MWATLANTGYMGGLWRDDDSFIRITSRSICALVARKLIRKPELKEEDLHWLQQVLGKSQDAIDIATVPVQDQMNFKAFVMGVLPDPQSSLSTDDAALFNETLTIILSERFNDPNYPATSVIPNLQNQLSKEIEWIRQYDPEDAQKVFNRLHTIFTSPDAGFPTSAPVAPAPAPSDPTPSVPAAPAPPAPPPPAAPTPPTSPTSPSPAAPAPPTPPTPPSPVEPVAPAPASTAPAAPAAPVPIPAPPAPHFYPPYPYQAPYSLPPIAVPPPPSPPPAYHVPPQVVEVAPTPAPPPPASIIHVNPVFNNMGPPMEAPVGAPVEAPVPVPQFYYEPPRHPPPVTYADPAFAGSVYGRPPSVESLPQPRSRSSRAPSSRSGCHVM